MKEELREIRRKERRNGERSDEPREIRKEERRGIRNGRTLRDKKEGQCKYRRE